LSDLCAFDIDRSADFLVSVVVTRPISLAFIIATVVILFVMAAPAVRKWWNAAGASSRESVAE
jgi:hypothetical protein